MVTVNVEKIELLRLRDLANTINIMKFHILYELQNSIEAVDARIDILSVETFTKNV